MKVKLTGFMNYTETPIEKSWVKAVSDMGLKARNPNSLKLYNMFEEPIISRKANSQSGSTEYGRWLDDKFFLATPEGVIDGVDLETVARYLNDPTKTYEVVSFMLGNENRLHEMDVYLFFTQGRLDNTYDHMCSEGITIPKILRERGLEVVGKDEVQMLQEAIGDKGTYVDMFKLFLEKLKG